MSAPAVSDDLMFASALSLRQPTAGHRVGTDAVLLAAATPPAAIRIADLGAGTGMVGLRAAQMNASAEVVLFERDASLVALAGQNILANHLSGRAQAHQADVFELGRDPVFREAFDCVLTNPPFRDPARARPSLNSAKSAAHVMQPSPRHGESGLEGWLRNAASILKPTGRIVMIHMADALDEILPALDRRFGALHLRFVHPQPGSAATRLLISGTKGSRARLKVLEPLILHQDGGAFSPEAQALHAGEARMRLAERE